MEIAYPSPTHRGQCANTRRLEKHYLTCNAISLSITAMRDFDLLMEVRPEL